MTKNHIQFGSNEKFPAPTYGDAQLSKLNGIDTFAMLIGPKEAAMLLHSNVNNRPISEKHVALLANSMKKGEWALNGEPLIFFKDGTLGNGQHRLYAIIRSETTQQFLVVRGVDNATFSTMDGGRKRAGSDVLSLAGEENSVTLSSTARAFLMYHLTGRSAFLITPSQILTCVKENPDLRVWNTKRVSVKSLKRFPSALAAYATIAARKHGDEPMNIFFDQLATGADLKAGSPALLLRDRLTTNQVSKLSKQMQNAFMIKAINAHIQGRQLGFLRWKDDEDFPSII
jgi:hypothetical protein